MKLIFTVLFAALTAAVFAQSNYHGGFVVKSSGDTLKGFINYREWENNPKIIDFKTKKTDNQVQKFNPGTIKSFQVTGFETYISYAGTISTDRTRFPDLPLGLDTSTRIDTIFLKQIVTGKYLTFFYHKDNIKVRFFIATTAEQPEELKYSQYYDTQNQVGTRNAYRRQLFLYANKFAPDDSKLNREITDARYNESDLEKIITEINGTNTTSSKKLAAPLRFFAGFGLNDTKTTVHDGIGVYTPYENFSKTISPQINFGVDIFINPNVQQLIFRTELSLSYLKADFSNIHYLGGPFTFSQKSAMLTPQLLFNFYNKDDVKVYIAGGARLNFSSYTSNNYIDWASSWGTLPVLQIGLVLNKKVEISFTYIGNTSYTRYTSDFNIYSQSMGLGFRYLFGKN